ncbi:alpha/beta hydrolase, partial [Nocardia alni]|uniref:alpha/beta hydrolase n=1 Tax=Nocardia alni TaxID=2815723 RepID=UPI001C251330
PAKQVDEPAKQVDEPAKQVDEPAKQVDEPAKQVDEPAKQVDEPAKQVDDTTDHEPAYKTRRPSRPRKNSPLRIKDAEKTPQDEHTPAVTPAETSLFEGHEDYVLGGLFDEPKQSPKSTDPNDGDTYYGFDLASTFEVDYPHDLTPTMQSFGNRRTGQGNLVYYEPIPEETVTWLREHVIREVTGGREDKKFRAAVERELTSELLGNKKGRLLSVSGMPLNVVYKGKKYPIFLRLSLRALGPSPKRTSPGAEPPVTRIQRFSTESTRNGNRFSNTTVRSGSFAQSNKLPYSKGVLHATYANWQLDARLNELNSGSHASSIVKTTSKMRSQGDHESYDLEPTWELRLGEGLSDLFSPQRLTGWKAIEEKAPNILRAHFPTFMTTGKIPTADPDDLATVPVPMSLLRDTLYGTHDVPDTDQIHADVVASFGPYFSRLAEPSVEDLWTFFDPDNFHDLIQQMWDDTVVSPTLYTENGYEIGYLRFTLKMSDGTRITGPIAKKMRFELYTIREVTVQGISTVTNSTGVLLAPMSYWGASDSTATGVFSPLDVRVTFPRLGITNQFRHSQNHSSRGVTARTLRNESDLLHVTPTATIHVDLVRPDGPPLLPDPRSPLHGGKGYPVNMLVPSVKSFGHPPTERRYPTGKLLHLEQFGLTTTPLSVEGTEPLFDWFEKYLAARGMMNLANRQKLDQMKGRVSLKGTVNEALQGGAPKWFELSGKTNTRSISATLVTQRKYLAKDPYDDVSHDWTLPGFPTMNYAGSGTTSGEEYSNEPLATSLSINAQLNNPNSTTGRQAGRIAMAYTRATGWDSVRNHGWNSAENRYAHTPKKEGTQFFSWPVVHILVVTDSHETDPAPVSNDGVVRAAVPTHLTLSEAEKPAVAPPRSTHKTRALDPAKDSLIPKGDDHKYLTNAMTEFMTASAVLRPLAAKALTELAEEMRSIREAARAAVGLMPGSFPRDLEDQPDEERVLEDKSEQAIALVPLDKSGKAVAKEAKDDKAAAEEEAATTAELIQQQVTSELTVPPPAHLAPKKDDAPIEQSIPGAFPSDQPLNAPWNTEEPQLTVDWAAVGKALLKPAWYVVDRTTGLGRWISWTALGEPDGNPESMTAEVFDTTLMPGSLAAPELFSNYLPIDAPADDGAVSGLDFTGTVAGAIKNIRVVERKPTNMDSENWRLIADRSGQGVTNFKGHRGGPTGSLFHKTSADDAEEETYGSIALGVQGTMSEQDHSAAESISNANYSYTYGAEPMYEFTADAEYILSVTAATRNMYRNPFPGGARTKAYSVEIPDAVMFYLTRSDLDSNPELAKLVREKLEPDLKTGSKSEDPPPSGYRDTGQLGSGIITKVNVRGERNALENLVVEHVHSKAGAVTDPKSWSHIPGVRTRINKATSDLGLLRLLNGGPNAREIIRFIDARFIVPRLVTIKLTARIDPNADLDDLAKLNPRLLEDSAMLDYRRTFSGADGNGLSVPEKSRAPLPGATSAGKRITRGLQGIISPSGKVASGLQPGGTISAGETSVVDGTHQAIRGSGAWTRAATTTTYTIPYEVGVTVTSRLLTEALLADLASKGYDGLALLGRGLIYYGQNLAAMVLPPLEEDAEAEREPEPEPDDRKVVVADALVRFHTSETRAGAKRRNTTPGIYESDPTEPSEPAPDGSVAIQMNPPAELKSLLTQEPWKPDKPFVLRRFAGETELIQALRVVDPTLDLSRQPHALWSMLTYLQSSLPKALQFLTPESDVLEQSNLTNSALSVLQSLANTGKLVRFGSQTVASFLDSDVPPGRALTPAKNTVKDEGVYLKVSIHSPVVMQPSERISMEQTTSSENNYLSQNGRAYSFQSSGGLGAPAANSDNRNTPTNIPLAGQTVAHDAPRGTGQQTADYMRRGSQKKGSDGHYVQAVMVIEIQGRNGTLWVSADAELETFAEPPGHSDTTKGTKKTDVTKGTKKPGATKPPPSKNPLASIIEEPEDEEPNKLEDDAGQDKSTEKAASEKQAESSAPAGLKHQSIETEKSETKDDADQSHSETKKPETQKPAAEKLVFDALSESDQGKPLTFASNAIRGQRDRSPVVGGIPAPPGYVWESMRGNGDCFFYAMERTAYRTAPSTDEELAERIAKLRWAVTVKIAEHAYERNGYYHQFNTLIDAARAAPDAGYITPEELQDLLAARKNGTLREHFATQVQNLANQGIWSTAASHLVPSAASAVLRDGNILLGLRSEAYPTSTVILGPDTNAPPHATVLIHQSHYHLAIPTGAPIPHTPTPAKQPSAQPIKHPPAKTWNDFTDLLGTKFTQSTTTSFGKSAAALATVALLGDESGARYMWLPATGELHALTGSAPVTASLQQLLDSPEITLIRTPGNDEADTEPTTKLVIGLSKPFAGLPSTPPAIRPQFDTTRGPSTLKSLSTHPFSGLRTTGSRISSWLRTNSSTGSRGHVPNQLGAGRATDPAAAKEQAKTPTTTRPDGTTFHGDGSTPHTPVLDDATADHTPTTPLNNCVPLSLAEIRARTDSPIVRTIDRPTPGGIVREELEDAAGAELRSFGDHDDIAEELRRLGHGHIALVVDSYATADDYGIGAHAYLLVNHHGTITVVDKGLELEHEFPPQPPRELSGTSAILYTPQGLPVESTPHSQAPAVLADVPIGVDTHDKDPAGARSAAGPQRGRSISGDGSRSRDSGSRAETIAADLSRPSGIGIDGDDPWAAFHPSDRRPQFFPPHPPPGLDGIARAPESLDAQRDQLQAVADWWRDTGNQWWQSLRFADLPAGDQLALATAFPGLRNSDAVPAGVRDTLNRQYLRLELSRLTAANALPRRATARPLSPTERRRLRNLSAMRNNMSSAELQARTAAGTFGIDPPVVTLLKLDPDAFNGRGTTVISFGDIDTAQSVSWYVPGIGTELTTMSPDVVNGMNHYAAIQLESPGHSAAVVVWVDYETPAGFNQPLHMARSARPTLAVAGAQRLRGTLTAFHRARQLADSGSTPEIHLFAHSYGSVTASHAAHGAHLAEALTSLTLLGSPGAGPARHASDYGLPPDRVFALIAADDPVTWMAAQHPNLRGAILSPLQRLAGTGHGLSPASEHFGASRLRAEYPERYTGLTAHRQQFGFTKDAHGHPTPSESLGNIARIATGKYNDLTREAHRPGPSRPSSLRRWVLSSVKDPAARRARTAAGQSRPDGSSPHPSRTRDQRPPTQGATTLPARPDHISDGSTPARDTLTGQYCAPLTLEYTAAGKPNTPIDLGKLGAVALGGVTVPRFQEAAGAELQEFDTATITDNHATIGAILRDDPMLGHGARAVVVDAYHSKNEFGVGAHAYNLENDEGVIVVVDRTTDQRYPLSEHPTPRDLRVVTAAFYRPDGSAYRAPDITVTGATALGNTRIGMDHGRGDGSTPHRRTANSERDTASEFTPEDGETFFGDDLLDKLDFQLESRPPRRRVTFEEPGFEPPTLRERDRHENLSSRRRHELLPEPGVAFEFPSPRGNNTLVVFDHHGELTRLPPTGEEQADIVERHGHRYYEFRSDGERRYIPIMDDDSGMRFRPSRRNRDKGTLTWDVGEGEIRFAAIDDRDRPTTVRLKLGASVVLTPRRGQEKSWWLKLPGKSEEFRIKARTQLLDDLPTLADRSADPLFGPAGVRPEDTAQGYIGDCTLISHLKAMAVSDPAAIPELVHDHGDGTVSVRFIVDRKPEWVRVTKRIYLSPGTDTGHFVQHKPGEPLWASMIEKAYAVRFNKGNGFHDFGADHDLVVLAKRLSRGYFRSGNSNRRQPVGFTDDGNYLNPLRFDVDTLHDIVLANISDDHSGPVDFEFSRQLADTYHLLRHDHRVQRDQLERELDRIGPRDKEARAAAREHHKNNLSARTPAGFRAYLDRALADHLAERHPGEPNRWDAEKDALTAYFDSITTGHPRDRELPLSTAPGARAVALQIDYALQRGTAVTLGISKYKGLPEDFEGDAVPGLTAQHSYTVIGVERDASGTPLRVLVDNPLDDNNDYLAPVAGLEYRLDPEPETPIPAGGTRHREAPDGKQYGTLEDGTRYRRDPHPDPDDPEKVVYSEYRLTGDGIRMFKSLDGTVYREEPDGTVRWRTPDGTEYWTDPKRVKRVMRPGDTDWSDDPNRKDPSSPATPRRGGIVAVHLAQLGKFSYLGMSGPGAYGLYRNEPSGKSRDTRMPRAPNSGNAPAPGVSARPTEPTRWEPVRDTADPLFAALARIANLPDAAAVRARIHESLNEFERSTPQTTATTTWLARSRALLAADPAEQLTATDPLVVDPPLVLAAYSLGMNVVSVHPDGRRFETGIFEGQPDVFLRRGSDGRYEIGVTPAGNLFASPRDTAQSAGGARPGRAIPEEQIPAPLTRVLASSQTPLLDGAALDKKYAGEIRPITARTSLDPIPDARKLDELDEIAFHTPVEHMTPEELEQHRVFVGPGGLLYRVADGMPLDTVAESPSGRSIFVMDEFGNLYAGTLKPGVRHHSSFLGGRTVTAAGEIAVRGGRLIAMGDRSGHYLPRAEINDYALDVLRHQGLHIGYDFQRLDHENQPRERFGELDRQREEIARQQILLDAADTAISRKEAALGAPDAVHDPTIRTVVQASRGAVSRQRAAMAQWRTGLDADRVQNDLLNQIFAHPSPTGPEDRIRPPQAPPELDAAQRSSRDLATWWSEHGRDWWDGLHFDHLAPAYQSGLLTGFPGLRNGEGIPAAVRNTLNRKHLQLEINRLTTLGDSSDLSPNAQRQLHNLTSALTDVYAAQLEATVIANRTGGTATPVHLLSFDQDPQGRQPAATIAYGDVDTATSVHWHVPADASISAMEHAVSEAARQHAENAAAQSNTATVLTVDPAAGQSAQTWSWSLATLFTGRGPNRLATAITAFTEARRSGPNAARPLEVALHAPETLAKATAPHVDSDIVTVDGSGPNRITDSAETTPHDGSDPAPIAGVSRPPAGLLPLRGTVTLAVTRPDGTIAQVPSAETSENRSTTTTSNTRPADGNIAETSEFEPADGETYFGADLLDKLGVPEASAHDATPVEQQHDDHPEPVLPDSRFDALDKLTPEQREELLPVLPVPSSLAHPRAPVDDDVFDFTDTDDDVITLVDHGGRVHRLPTDDAVQARKIQQQDGSWAYRIARPNGRHRLIPAALVEDFEFEPNRPGSDSGLLSWDIDMSESGGEVRFLGVDAQGRPSVLRVPYDEPIVVRPGTDSQRWIKLPDESRSVSVTAPRGVLPKLPDLVDRRDDPVFAPSGPRSQDARQGAAGDCGLLAVLKHRAEHNPRSITEMMHDHGNGVVSVRFLVDGAFEWIPVTKEIYETDGKGHFVGHEPGEPLWAGLIEKAYARRFGNGDGYHALDTIAGHPAEVDSHLGTGSYQAPGSDRRQPVRSVDDTSYLHPLGFDADTLHDLVQQRMRAGAPAGTPRKLLPEADVEFSRELAESYDDWRRERSELRSATWRALEAAHGNDRSARDAAWQEFTRTGDPGTPEGFRKDLDRRFPGRWEAEKDALAGYFSALRGNEPAKRLLADDFATAKQAIGRRIDWALRRGTTVTLTTHTFGPGTENRTAVPGLAGNHVYAVHATEHDESGEPVRVLLENPWDHQPWNAERVYRTPAPGITYRLDPRGMQYTPDANGNRYRRVPHTGADGTPDGTYTEYGLRPDGTQYRRDPDGTLYSIARNGMRYSQGRDGVQHVTFPDGSRTWRTPDTTEFHTDKNGGKWVRRPGAPRPSPD